MGSKACSGQSAPCSQLFSDCDPREKEHQQSRAESKHEGNFFFFYINEVGSKKLDTEMPN